MRRILSLIAFFVCVGVIQAEDKHLSMETGLFEQWAKIEGTHRIQKRDVGDKRYNVSIVVKKAGKVNDVVITDGGGKKMELKKYKTGRSVKDLGLGEAKTPGKFESVGFGFNDGKDWILFWIPEKLVEGGANDNCIDYDKDPPSKKK